MKVNDVFRHNMTSELYVVTRVKQDTITLDQVYGDQQIELLGDVVDSFKTIYTFCWNAVEEGWAGA